MYTSGPWSLDHNSAIIHIRPRGTGFIVAIVDLGASEEHPGSHHENARLIAAAPDMATACEDVAISLDRIASQLGDLGAPLATLAQRLRSAVPNFL